MSFFEFTAKVRRTFVAERFGHFLGPPVVANKFLCLELPQEIQPLLRRESYFCVNESAKAA